MMLGKKRSSLPTAQRRPNATRPGISLLLCLLLRLYDLYTLCSISETGIKPVIQHYVRAVLYFLQELTFTQTIRNLLILAHLTQQP